MPDQPQIPDPTPPPLPHPPGIPLQYDSITTRVELPPIDPKVQKRQFFTALLIGSVLSLLIYAPEAGALFSPIVLIIKLLIAFICLFFRNVRMVSAGLFVSILVGFTIVMIRCGVMKH